MPRTAAASTNAHLTHFVVDGSNIATEGRAVPSLKQLNEAVLAFMEERPGTLITVVVDATFGHRIDAKEVKAFDEAVANNELVTPPAGAVGRGDAFVLSIANKAQAGILSNDSFQEFHGDYSWLFEPGRLIGGKPVPHVGWVFVERLPVRGPKSRQSVKEAKHSPKTSSRAARSTGSPLADRPMPVPTAPPPGPAAAAKGKRQAADTAAVLATATVAATGNDGQQSNRSAVNDLLPFLEFVERHPVGTGCTVVVESYASHGAYARAGDVLVYVPLRLMGDPPPRSARAALKIGEAVAVLIVGYIPERRSIDAALVSAGDAAAKAPVTEVPPAAPEPAEPATKRRSRKKPAADEPAPVEQPVPAEPVAEQPTKRRRTTKKAAAEAAEAQPALPLEQPAQPAPTKRSSRRKAEPTPAATPDPAPEAAPKPKPARKRAAKRTAEPPATAAAPAERPVKRAARAPKAATPVEATDKPAATRKRAAKKPAKKQA